MMKGLYNDGKWIGASSTGAVISSSDAVGLDFLWEGCTVYPDERPAVDHVFSHDFFNLTSVSIGNELGTTDHHKPHVTYKYIQLNGTDLIDLNTVCDGNNRFTKSDIAVDWSVDILKVSLDMSKCTATTAGEDLMETVLGIGEDSSTWDRAKATVFFYGYKSGDKCYLVVQMLDNQYKNATHRKIVYIEDGLADIEISWRSILVNGEQLYVDLSKDSKLSGYSLGDTVNIKSDDCLAYIDQVSIRRIVSSSATTEIVESGFQPGGSEFYKNFNSSLSGLCVSAEIDTSGYTTGTLNILSVGTDIASWGTVAHNIHIYYTGSVLEFDAVDAAHPNAENRKVYSVVKGSIVTITINSSGINFKLNDTSTLVYDSTNSVIAYLFSDSTTSFAVGSKEGSVRSTLKYNRLVVEGESYTINETKLIEGMEAEQFETGDQAIDFIAGGSIYLKIQPKKICRTLFKLVGSDHTITVKYLWKGIFHVQYDDSIILEQHMTEADTYEFLFSRFGGLSVNSKQLFFDPVLPYLPYRSDMIGEPVMFKRGVHGGYLHGQYLVEGNDKMLGDGKFYVGLNGKWLSYKDGKTCWDADKYEISNDGGHCYIEIEDGVFNGKNIYGKNRVDLVTSETYNESKDWVIWQK